MASRVSITRESLDIYDRAIAALKKKPARVIAEDRHAVAVCFRMIQNVALTKGQSELILFTIRLADDCKRGKKSAQQLVAQKQLIPQALDAFIRGTALKRLKPSAIEYITRWKEVLEHQILLNILRRNIKDTKIH